MIKKLLYLILMLALVSCSTASKDYPTATSPFSNSTCSLPCWYGITVGKTTKQEAIDILQGIDLVNSKSIRVVQSSPDDFFDEVVRFTLGRGPRYLEARSDVSNDKFTKEPTSIRVDYDWGGQISILDDKVSQIGFSGDLGVTVQQIIDIFGDPSYVIPFMSPGGSVQVELLNPSQGVDFRYGTEDPDPKITPETKINNLILFDPALYNEMLKNYQFAFLFWWNSENMNKYEWKGFGKIDMHWHVEN